MQSFLEQVVVALRQAHGTDIADICIVVPTRRAVVFLRKALAEVYQQPLLAPRLISIQDFVREIAGQQFPDIMPLVFELYQVYMERMRRHDPKWQEPFERFYSWGEMLVKDFDELDKYCVPAEKLFTNIKDLKEIDLFFSLEEEELEPIRRFWETIRGREEGPTEVQEKFLRIWEVLFDIYTGFRARLQARGMAYDGMAYRKIVDQLEIDTLTLDYKEIWFVGFNALSRAEEAIMEYLLEKKQAKVLWDVDTAYFSPPEARASSLITGEEAGKFIRHYHKKWAKLGSELILHQMKESEKQIYHTGVPLQVGQAQYLGNLLQETEFREEDFSQIAIVIADENLLFPVLYALPEKVERLNITMGFPLRQTNMYNLWVTVMRLLRNMRIDALGKLSFSHKEVLEILNNPYIKARQHALSEEMQTEIAKKNWVYIPTTHLLEKSLSPLLKHIFSPPVKKSTTEKTTLTPILTYCKDIFSALLEDAQERKALLEVEYIFQFFTQFQQLSEVLERYKPQLSLHGFSRLFQEVLQRVRIPFEGEPLVGVQLMGFLETRVLDFKKVYILAANEGSLPDTSTGNSFIPYNLRKGFGLPTYEEKDAIYAYHFYRLLQRAEEVHLIYNTVVNDSGGAKEVSRFIRQIRHFFRDQPFLQVQERIVSAPAPYSEQFPIKIGASETTRNILYHNYSRRYLSATALTTWLGCPLRFYYRYIAGIKEPDQIEESMAANTFGSVLHETMEILYGSHLQQDITADIINTMKAKLDAAMEQAFKKQGLGWEDSLHGKNFLLKGVIEKLCTRMLDMDAESRPFQVISLEDPDSYLHQVDIDGKPVRINGTLDRIDLLTEENIVRILDYKTGKVTLNQRLTIDACFEDDTYKEAFQGYLYAWLYTRKHPGQAVIVGFYTARHLSDGIQYLNNGKPISPEELEHFERLLLDLIQKIFQREYVQTEDEKKCGYCVYKEICNR